jgi:hypothetical protein
MTEFTPPYGRMIEAGLGAWRLSLQIAETMIASQAVIGSRMAMFGAGLMQPATMDWAEFGRMMPEKASAFGRANAGAARGWAPKGAATQPSWGTLPAALTSDAMTALDLFERSLAASTAWWRPVHATAKANARRLGRKKG